MFSRDMEFVLACNAWVTLTFTGCVGLMLWLA